MKRQIIADPLRAHATGIPLSGASQLREELEMTFTGALAPLMIAAEKYAALSEIHPTHNIPTRKLGCVIQEQKEAEIALLKAAIEFAKWGKSQGGNQ